MKATESRRPDDSVDAETLGRPVHHAEPTKVLAFGQRVVCGSCFGNGRRFAWVDCHRCGNVGTVLRPVLREVGK